MSLWERMPLNGYKLLSTLYHFEFSLITEVSTFFFGKHCTKNAKNLLQIPDLALPYPQVQSL